MPPLAVSRFIAVSLLKSKVTQILCVGVHKCVYVQECPFITGELLVSNNPTDTLKLDQNFSKIDSVFPMQVLYTQGMITVYLKNQ